MFKAEKYTTKTTTTWALNKLFYRRYVKSRSKSSKSESNEMSTLTLADISVREVVAGIARVTFAGTRHSAQYTVHGARCTTHNDISLHCQ